MALAEATRGATEWEGLGLLSGSRINDTATAFSIFCSQYSTERWGDLLRKELPELTDEDIEWLCGLTETMESHEPAIVHKDQGFEEAALMMKLPKRHATPWKGGPACTNIKIRVGLHSR